MKNVKKGSSLISVVMIFAILFILSTSIIAVTVSDYKLRVKNNQKVKNLYGSESGLEEAYAKLGELIDKAVVMANEEVNKNIQEVNKNNKKPLEYKEKNNIFRETYKSYIEYNAIGTIENEDYLSKLSIKPEIEILSKKDNIVKFDEKDELNLEVQSSFKNKEIDRIIKTTFNVKTPDYNKTESYKSVKIPIKNSWTKSFVVGKDFINKGDLEVLGDIYVLGEGNNSTGVLLEDSNSKFSLKGNLVSLKDIRVQGNNSKFEVTSNKNSSEEDLSKIYTGTLSIDRDANNSSIDINGQVYAHNDLSLNAEKSKINITKGFYGINDVGTKENSLAGQESKNSSCIIVNTTDIGNGSNISIGHEAILMGTAYINVEKPYQTGESVGIKGNYRAYGVPLTNNTKFNENNVKFEYRNPLQLVTKFKDGKALLYDEKGQYLGQYIEQYGEQNINMGKGIDLPENNTIHVGAIFDKGSFKLLGYKAEDNDKIKDRKNKYITATSEIKTIEDEINFSKIKNTNEVKTYTDGTEIIYLSNSGEDCVLLGSGENAEGFNADNIIDISKNNKARGIIITKGNVYIRGKITEFKGTIIAGGNIIFEDNKPKKFVYDNDYIKKLVGAKYSIFKDIFIGKNLLTEVVQWEVTKDGEENLTGGYIRQRLLHSKNWRIIK